uniref:Carbonic anhydrase n=1 Tax=Salmo trutta TaxID=8032 RepID=A0A673Z8I9_SALTR
MRLYLSSLQSVLQAVVSDYYIILLHCDSWCYHDPSCGDTTWPTIASEHCNGSRQSPINIVSASAVVDATLTTFTFTKYGDNYTMKNIKNTGKTVKVKLTSGVQIAGGALSNAYDSLQFHLHWGNGTSVPGSEHTVDGTHYPMELHIVNAKSSHNGNTTTAVTDSMGLAALGFFIEVRGSWNTLTSYLANITLKDDIANITHAISLDELLEGVDRTKYYRYLGSLTTPNCNETVVWTVFKDPIKVSQDLATNVHVSAQTVRNRLHEGGMRARRPQVGVVLTAQHRAGRLAFAREHQDKANLPLAPCALHR